MHVAPVPDEHSLRYVQIREVLKRVQKTLGSVKGQPTDTHDLKTILGDVNYAIKRLDDALDVKSDRWKCSSCGHVAVFSRPVARSAAGKCTRCGKSEFEPASKS